MSIIKLYEVVEIMNPTHPRHGQHGVVGGTLVVDSEVFSYDIHFVSGTELIDPEDLVQTGERISESDFQNGVWPATCLDPKE